MVKKNKIRSNNRTTKAVQEEQTSMVLNMLRCFNLGHMYFKRGKFDHVAISLNDRKIINGISISKEVLPMDSTRRYLIDIYNFVDDVLEKARATCKELGLEMVSAPSFDNPEMNMNIFFLFQYRFNNGSDLIHVLNKLNMDKFETVRYAIIKYGHMVFAYDISFLNKNMDIIKTVYEVCYRECKGCNRVLNKVDLIHQCGKCFKVCCESCNNKRCSFCSK